jgi:hypothetical protein
VYPILHVNLSTLLVVAMSRTRLSCLVVFMIVLQSLTAVVEAHAFDQSESTPSAHDALHKTFSDTPQLDDHGDSDEPNTQLDHVLHCPHHGCHCPLLLSGGATVPAVERMSSINSNSRDRIPDAPISSLFRPPIA